MIPELLTPEDGDVLVSSAREAIDSYLSKSKWVVPSRLSGPRFQQKQGCFVTLRIKKGGDLRGCIGFAEPIFELSQALTRAAISSATEDPRFPPVTLKELERLMIEVSVLTTPKVIHSSARKELPKLIEVGKDGLILKWSFGSGLLLPQVPEEFGWDAEEYLANLSMKAGAPPDQWLVPESVILKFQAQVFQEQS